ncbi:MAG: hypothetical protein RMK90_04605 [Acetobacteraceae bacterium]|nr:hypothetical protein [Acetobacteraceae bacterium]
MEERLLILPGRPGAAGESQSGLNQAAPRIYGRLLAPPGARSAAVLAHPTSNFLNHYLLAPLAARGIAALALNTRYAGNDTTLLMEQAIADLGAGVRHLREAGFGRVLLLGNSGGGALVSLYQAQAERRFLHDLPCGRPFPLAPEETPPADAIALFAAHPGRARTLLAWLDPSVIDEADPQATDPAWDMFNPANGPPYDPAWLAAYRERQRARRDRIEERVRARLRMLGADPSGPQDEALLVHRTHADPRFLDLSLDPNERAAGSIWGDPRAVNRAANAMGRFSTLRSWLSQWSAASRADGPARLAETSVPVLVVDHRADSSVFPSDNAAWLEAAASRPAGGPARLEALPGGDHYLSGRPDLVARLADLIADFAAGV